MIPISDRDGSRRFIGIDTKPHTIHPIRITTIPLAHRHVHSAASLLTAPSGVLRERGRVHRLQPRDCSSKRKTFPPVDELEACRQDSPERAPDPRRHPGAVRDPEHWPRGPQSGLASVRTHEPEKAEEDAVLEIDRRAIHPHAASAARPRPFDLEASDDRRVVRRPLVLHRRRRHETPHLPEEHLEALEEDSASAALLRPWTLLHCGSEAENTGRAFLDARAREERAWEADRGEDRACGIA